MSRKRNSQFTDVSRELLLMVSHHRIGLRFGDTFCFAMIYLGEELRSSFGVMLCH